MKSKKVKHELGKNEADDPLAEIYRNMQARNAFCVKWLNMHNFQGDELRASIDVKKKSVKAKITVPHSKERIEA